MAPPKCKGPCGGTTLTELESRGLRLAWRASEGSQWSWRWHESRRTVCAYLHCCLDCHKLAWPGDGRQNNRDSQPREERWRRVCRGSCSQLTVGDFSLNVWDIGGQKTIRPYWRNYWIMSLSCYSTLSNTSKFENGQAKS